MKVISVIQPWATLIAIREKGLETRSWATKHRGDLAIHASKKVDKAACRQEPFKSVLARHVFDETNLPTGVILATSRLAECYKVIENREDEAVLEPGYIVSGNEYQFGDYTEGRFAWALIDVKPLPTPIPAKGQLGLWNYSLEEVLIHE